MNYHTLGATKTPWECDPVLPPAQGSVPLTLPTPTELRWSPKVSPPCSTSGEPPAQAPTAAAAGGNSAGYSQDVTAPEKWELNTTEL